MFGSANLVQFASMMTREQQLTVWSTAYNAALTGLITARTSGMDNYTEHNVSGITKQCKAFADQALKDAASFEG